MSRFPSVPHLESSPWPCIGALDFPSSSTDEHAAVLESMGTREDHA